MIRALGAIAFFSGISCIIIEAMEINEVKQITDNFVREIEEASKKQPSSLPFIVHTLPTKPLVKPGEEFQVIVIGGSIYQNALCRFVDGKLEIMKRSNGQKPYFNTKQDLLDFVDSLLMPDITIIALNFAYPLEPYFNDGKLDGKLMFAVKENAFEGLIGEAIGETFEQHLKEKYNRTVKVTVANDTICTLLSGLHYYNAEETACGIVGTGVNFAYFIDPLTPVNLESANFNKFTQSKYGKIVDTQSASPGKGLFEKEISGAYLFRHFNAYTQEHKLKEHVNSTRELDAFAKTCNGSGICEFTKEIIERAAAYVAVQVAAITKVKQHDMKFIMAGSLFWRAWTLKDSVKKYVGYLVPEYTVEFVPIESCEIYGAAKLVG